MNIGTLYGISVGTGDPELITVKGLRLLQEAKIVAFPAGINQKPGIAEQIIAQWLQPEQVTISLDFPYTQDETVLEKAWQQAAAAVWQYLKKGIDVAFACEGDVSFYSTFTYLAQTLQKFHGEVPIITVSPVQIPNDNAPDESGTVPTASYPPLKQALLYMSQSIIKKIVYRLQS